MKINLPQSLVNLAEKLNNEGIKLYVVGGYIRNFLIDGTFSSDIDICAPIDTAEFCEKAKALNFTIDAVYGRTGTVKLSFLNNHFEFSPFRKEVYIKDGSHTPQNTILTDDLVSDAKRRDFKINAIYYDICDMKIVDPLNGLSDIKNKIIDTVVNSESVFENDGLRLLRLCRFCSQLNFSPTKQVISALKKYSDNILGISCERILDELKLIIYSREKYPFSDKNGAYNAIKLLAENNILSKIFNMPNSINYEKFSALDSVPKEYRLCVFFILLSTDGENFDLPLLKDIMARLKLDKRTAKNTILSFIGVEKFSNNPPEKEFTHLILEYRNVLNAIIGYFSAVENYMPVKKITEKYQSMINEGCVFDVKELNITAQELLNIGIKRQDLSKVLKILLIEVAHKSCENNNESLKMVANSLKFLT